MKLCRFALADDYDDVQELMAAASGTTRIGRMTEVCESRTPKLEADAAAAVEAVLDEITADTLAKNIGVPIDQARATYVAHEVLIESKAAVLDASASFYLHLLRHTQGLVELSDCDQVAAEATALLGRAFVDRGGLAGAYAEARCGSAGGMRHILDAMTEQYKAEKSANHVSRVIEEAVVSLELDDKTQFMRALLDRIGHELPAELREIPPEALASQCQAIVKAYTNSMDRVRQVLRAI